jgi:hypothetical protein
MALKKLHLIYHPKDKGTFKSARWGKDYTPDLSIVTRAHLDDNPLCNRYILESFPRSQHRPFLLHYGIRVPLTESIGIFHLLIGSHLLQKLITLFDSSLIFMAFTRDSLKVLSD